MKLGAKTAIGIEQRPVAILVQKAALGVLTVDFDQLLADAPQKRDTDRLIVHEGAAAAVFGLHAAQDEIAIGLEIVLTGNLTGGMIAGDIEHGSDTALVRTTTNQTGIGAAANGKPQRIKQDRLARPGLAGKRA